MNPPAAGKSSTRGSGYHQKALAEIRNSLLPFANIGGVGEVGSSAASTISTVSTTSGISSASGLSGLSGASGSIADKPDQRQALGQLLAMGYSEVKRTITLFNFCFSRSLMNYWSIFNLFYLFILCIEFFGL